ncbi:bifunctional 3-(3-hydroxy-phenyl)propionate/3-hydroxycinnamic acid hydroxylase, partial [Streptomyces sp. SID5914]
HDWLVLDVIPHDKNRVWSPDNLQICDPTRPTTVVAGGPGRRRWEFMRLPGETLADLNQEDRAWELLRPHDIHPANAVLERHTVYTFEARWADTWREGRLLLAGDAAHQMPPFAGQGMCSGIRDALNLTWKLDLVLSGDAHEALLDTYTAERGQHLQRAIESSLRLGGIICEPDPAAAAERDAYMFALLREGTSPLANLPPRALSVGLLMRDGDGTPVTSAGRLVGQGRVRFRGETGLFDQVVGTGFALLTTQDAHPQLDAASLAWCEEIGVRMLRITDDRAADGPIDVVDLDGVYLSQLTESGQTALLVRPDHYVFGGVTGLEEVPRLVAALREGLAGRPVGLQPA